MAKAIRLSVTEVLLKKGLVGEKDAEEARENHRNNGENFADTLVRMGLITRPPFDLILLISSFWVRMLKNPSPSQLVRV